MPASCPSRPWQFASPPRGKPPGLPLRSLAAFTAGCLLAATGSAQGAAASESGVVIAMGTAASGGNAEGSVTGGQLSFTAGQSASGERAASTNFILEPGVAWSASEFVGTAPLVTGLRPGLADKDGGEIATVFGFNFAGAGFPSVTFNGINGVGEAILGNTQVRVTTPVGLDTFQNPLVNVDLGLSNSQGSFTAADAMHFTPALVAGNSAHLNRKFKMRLHGNPGDFYLLVFGSSLGIGVPLPPYDGQLEIISNLLFLTPTVVAMPNGIGDFVIDMPSNPPLVGFLMEFQSIVLDPSFTAGAWTNRLPVTIQADN